MSLFSPKPGPLPVAILIILLLFICLPALAADIDGFRPPHNDPLRVGGPDAFGYYFIDSDDDAVNAPDYNWIDISQIGENLNIRFDDQTIGPCSLMFNVAYYGSNFNRFWVCSNGFISFSSNLNSSLNEWIPSANQPNNLLSVFWDDLKPDTSDPLCNVYFYSNFVDTAIVSWHHFRRFSGFGNYTFQAIITGDGNIKYQYEIMAGLLNSHSIGIENYNGSIGLEYIYDVENNPSYSAILFGLHPPEYGYKNILVVAADSATAYISSLLSYDDIGFVDYFDARDSTPPFQTLLEYDGVVVWSYARFADSVALGNVLADYIERGRAVVLHQHCFTSGWQLGGRLMSQYSSFIPGAIHPQSRALGARDRGHPLMFAVNVGADSFTANVTLADSAFLVAAYNDSTPFIAYNPVNNLVVANYYVGDSRVFSDSLRELAHNAVNFALDGPADILIVAADSVIRAKRDLYLFPDINSVHIYNAIVATPPAELLDRYRTVLVWGNSAFQDRILAGNRLADFVDSSPQHGVILLQFSFGQTGRLGGRLMSDYSPFLPIVNNFGYRNLGWFDPSHPLMDSVTAINDYFVSEVELQNSGHVVAKWDDSTLFVAHNPAENVIAINGYIGDYRDFTGDMITLVHNAISFSRDFQNDIEIPPAVPRRFVLYQNYPNPFNSSTVIEFDLPRTSDVNLEIFDILGRRLLSENYPALTPGRHSFTFSSERLGSGLYFYRLRGGDYSQTRKLMILK